MTTPLLPGPYGYDSWSFASVSLYSRDDADPTQVSEKLAWFSCWPPAVPKILQCLKYSNRYDCYVQRGWLVGEWELAIETFAKIGVLFIINRVVNMGREQSLEEMFNA